MARVVTGPSSSVGGRRSVIGRTSLGHEGLDVGHGPDPLGGRTEPHRDPVAAGRAGRAHRSRPRGAGRCRPRPGGSAPRRTGVSSGCLGRGAATQAHDSTTPPGPTSTSSPVSSPVVGSYSVGGHDDRPPGPRDPEQLPVAQPGQEGADDRAHRARVRVLEAVRWRAALRSRACRTSPWHLVERDVRKVEHISLLSANSRPVGTGRGPAPGLPWRPMAETATRRPNILLVVSDQERQRSWLPPGSPCPGGTGSGPRASSSPTTSPTPRRAPPAGPACSPGATSRATGCSTT